MLALARHHSWKTEGYNRSGHPVQQRIKREISRWTGLAESTIVEGEDGCTAVTFALPLFNMALAMVRLAVSEEAAPRTIVSAMVQNPLLVAGHGRLESVVAKVGAEGVYLAALPAKRLGIALKVEDGDALSAMVALVHVLDQLGLDPKPSDAFPRFAEPPVHNTRGIPVGSLRPMGGLEFK
jgi:L-asparaginase II